jgi:hypothetical protein
MKTAQGAKMKNMITKLSITFVAGALFCAAAAAAPVVDWDGAASGSAASVSGESLQAGFQALSQKVAAEKKTAVIYGVPTQYQDAFAGIPACNEIDAMLLRAFSLDEAVASLAPCMQGLSERYSIAVSAEKGAVGVNGGLDLVAGIVIHVPAEIQSGNHILMDLSYAIREKRHGKILGFPASVVSGTYDAQIPDSNDAAAR